jgi:uncharacterized membrane protein YhaH (DUF805 family)
MNLLQNAKSMYKQYAVFHGRATRRQYWMWVLFHALVAVVWVIAEVICLVGISAALNQEGRDYSNGDWLATGFWSVCFIGLLLVYGLFVIASLVPDLAAASRRLHDANLSAWWLLICLVPYVGRIILFVMLCLKTHPGPSAFEHEGSGTGRSANDPWASTSKTNSTSDW